MRERKMVSLDGRHATMGVRGLISATLWTLLYIAAAAPFVLGSQIGGAVLGHLLGAWFQPIFQGTVAIAGVFLVTWLFCTKLNRQAWSSMGLPAPQLGRVFLGLAAATACILGIAAIELGAGWLSVTRIDLSPHHGVPKVLLLGLAILPSLGVGFTEELAFRGYVFSAFRVRSPAWIAALISSVLWASMHFTIGGFGAGFVITVTGMGLLLVVLRELSGSLWLPIGFHAAWDYCQTYLIGLSTAGLTHDPALIQVRQLGPTFWVGQPPSIEGGALFTLLFLSGLAIGLVAVFSLRKESRNPVRASAGI